MEQEPEDQTQITEHKPWPLSWIFIVILAYIALQIAFFLFVAE